LNLKREMNSRYASLSFDHILALLLLEREKINGAIHALQDTTTQKTLGPDRKAALSSVEQDSELPAPVVSRAPAKRKLSTAGRRAIIAGTKERWAAIKAAKAAAEAPAPVAAKPKAAPAKASALAGKAGLTQAGRKALSIAMKKRWAAKKKVA
jgi:hypothetical protein